MRFGLEIKLARLAPAPHLDIVVGGLAHRHRLMRDIRYPRQHGPERLIQILHPVVQSSDTFAHGSNLLLQLRRIDALLSQFRDVGAFAIALRLKLLGFRHRRAPIGVERSELLGVQLEAARGQALRYRVQIGPK